MTDPTSRSAPESRVAEAGDGWKPFEHDYLLRTIETVRQHRGADNCWPQWANIFADEIERCWSLLAASPVPEEQPYESFVAEQGANLDAPYEGEEQP